jgi:hypothetical protein
MSLVRGQSVRRHLRLQLEFSLAFTASAASIFAVCWLTGQSLAPGYHLLPDGVLSVAILCPLIVLEVAEAAAGAPTCAVTVSRQTPRSVLWSAEARRTARAWGLDTGSVVSTYRVSAASWAALALVLTGEGPAWLGAIYALAFAVPLVVLTTSAAYVPSLRRAFTETRGTPRVRWLRTLATLVMVAVVVGLANQWA